MKNGFHISFITHDLERVGPLVSPKFGLDRSRPDPIWASSLSIKSVTYVSGTFVTLVSGPHTLPEGEGNHLAVRRHVDASRIFLPSP